MGGVRPSQTLTLSPWDPQFTRPTRHVTCGVQLGGDLGIKFRPCLVLLSLENLTI